MHTCFCGPRPYVWPVGTATGTGTGPPLFTTGYGRLKLWEVMHYLGDQFLFGKTDSALYVTGPGRRSLPHGTVLGQLKNDLPPRRHGMAFACTGPNSYVIRLDDGSEVSRVGGISTSDDLKDAQRLVRDDGEVLAVTERRMVRSGAAVGERDVQVKHRSRIGRLGRVVEHGPGRIQILPFD